MAISNELPFFSVPRASKIYPYWNFWFENIPSGNPATKTVAQLILLYCWTTNNRINWPQVQVVLCKCTSPLSSPPATEEIGAVGREIESRQGVGYVVVFIWVLIAIMYVYLLVRSETYFTNQIGPNWIGPSESNQIESIQVKVVHQMFKILVVGSSAGLQNFFWSNIPNGGKYTKLPLNIPNVYKIYQVAIMFIK
jgi:hypothetical protein